MLDEPKNNESLNKQVAGRIRWLKSNKFRKDIEPKGQKKEGFYSLPLFTLVVFRVTLLPRGPSTVVRFRVTVRPSLVRVDVWVVL